MKVLAPLVRVLLVVGFLVKFIWWILGIAAIAAVASIVWRLVAQSSSTASSAPKSRIREPAARASPPTRPAQRASGARS